MELALPPVTTSSGLAEVVRLPTASDERAQPVLAFSQPDAAPGGAFAPNAVPNALLRPGLVPPPDAAWESVEEFALTYDGYAYWSDVAELDRRALQRWTRDRSLPDDLDQLRGCLFYEERRWHHFGREPHGRGGAYMSALLGAIAQAVARTSADVGSAVLEARAG